MIRAGPGDAEERGRGVRGGPRPTERNLCRSSNGIFSSRPRCWPRRTFSSGSRCFNTLVLMLANISRRASLLSRAPDHVARPFGVS